MYSGNEAISDSACLRPLDIVTLQLRLMRGAEKKALLLYTLQGERALSGMGGTLGKRLSYGNIAFPFGT